MCNVLERTVSSYVTYSAVRDSDSGYCWDVIFGRIWGIPKCMLQSSKFAIACGVRWQLGTKAKQRTSLVIFDDYFFVFVRIVCGGIVVSVEEVLQEVLFGVCGIYFFQRKYCRRFSSVFVAFTFLGVPYLYTRSSSRSTLGWTPSLILSMIFFHCGCLPYMGSSQVVDQFFHVAIVLEEGCCV